MTASAPSGSATRKHRAGTLRSLRCCRYAGTALQSLYHQPLNSLGIAKVACTNDVAVASCMLSGKLMRTTYLPKWGKIVDKRRNQSVFYPQEQRVFDEVEKGTNTTIVVREVDLTDLPANMFTKAWLESKSR